MKKNAILTFVLVLIVSCNNQKIDSSKARAEMETREIKVISDAQIIDVAKKIGDRVSKTFSYPAYDSIDGLWVYRPYFGSDSLFQKDYYLFDDPKELQGKALAVFEAYQYNRDHGLEPFSNVQKLDNGRTLFYTAPMILGDTSFIGIWTVKIPRKYIVLHTDD